jgi:hypothetical protein
LQAPFDGTKARDIDDAVGAAQKFRGFLNRTAGFDRGLEIVDVQLTCLALACAQSPSVPIAATLVSLNGHMRIQR